MRKFRPLLPAYILMLGIIFILPWFSAEGYSLRANTASQLGAQCTPNAWIMNLSFVLLGLACIWEGWARLGSFWFHKAVLSAFGLGLVLTALYRHAPIDAQLEYSLREDQLHSLFATGVGLSFTLFAVASAFIAPTAKGRGLALTAALGATGFSILIFSVPQFAGLWQRLMFIAAFAWLIYFLTTTDMERQQ